MPPPPKYTRGKGHEETHAHKEKPNIADVYLALTKIEINLIVLSLSQENQRLHEK